MQFPALTLFPITPAHYLILSVLLFGIGTVGVLSRKNIFVLLMSVELMLSAANLAFVVFSGVHANMAGHLAVVFVIAIAAAEVSIGLAIIIALFRMRENIDPGVFNRLKG